MQKKQFILSMLFAGVAFISKGVAQDAPSSDDKLSASLTLNHDAFFGFNPMMALSYSLSDTDALTFYGIQQEMCVT